MSKIILIVDDRPFRRQNLLNEVWNNISSLDNVEHMTFMPSEEVVESFDIIAIHRSYVMSHEYYDYLTNLVKRHDKYIILFSGGISQYQLEESGRFLTLPVTDFYTNDLYLFCSELLVSDDVKLMKLIFGTERWKLPILMKMRELMWLDPEAENDDFQDQISELQQEAGVTDLSCIDNLISTLMH